MEKSVQESWPLLMVQGVFAILFGLFAFVYPGLSLGVLVLFFGIYALVDGAVLLVRGLGSMHKNKAWWMTALGGVISIAAGAAVFLYTGLTLQVLYWIIAAWAFVAGFVRILMAIDLRKEINDEWLLGISGVLSILLGVLLIANPGAGVVALGWYVGAYALLAGILVIALSLRLRKM